MSSWSRPTRSWPSNRIRPLAILPGYSIRPMTLRAVTLLPQPDSPTSPRVWPWATANETPSTAWTTPSAVLNWV